MKQIKTFGLVAATAFIAFAGTASATTLTSPAGTTLAAGTTVKMQLEGVWVLEAAFANIECGESAMEGEVGNSGGAAETVVFHFKKLTTTKCNCEVVVLGPGTEELHSIGGNRATVTVSGRKFTTTCFGVHCEWSTPLATHLGLLTGGTPAFVADNTRVARSGGRSGAFCGSESTMRAGYKVTSPSSLSVD